MNKVRKEQVPDTKGLGTSTDKVIKQQNITKGQRREVDVESYPSVSKLADLLKDLYFPASKSKILDYVIQSEDFSDKNRIIYALRNIKDRTYNGIADLTTSAGLVQQ
jgi:hypothetical protein